MAGEAVLAVPAAARARKNAWLIAKIIRKSVKILRHPAVLHPVPPEVIFRADPVAARARKNVFYIVLPTILILSALPI